MNIKRMDVAAALLAGTASFAVAEDAPETRPAASMPASVEPIAYPAPELLSTAGRRRLQAERTVMEQELLANARYDPAEVKSVVAAMQQGAADTVQDNRRRFAEALAGLNEQFAEGWSHYRRGNWTETARALEPLMRERVGLKATYKHNTMSPYCYTLTKLLYAECLGRMGNLKDAIISYQVVFEKLPNNLSFGATARMRAALLYEQTRRAHFAIPIYRALAAKYADLLVDEEILRVTLRRSDLVRSDAFRLSVRSSGKIAQRLERGDTGRATREAQTHMMDMLNRMLVIEEEEERPFLENTQVITFGAKTGELKEGAPPSDLSMLPALDEALAGNDDWGKLRPRQKQQLMQLFQQTYPQSYREMLEAYFRNLSEAESRDTAPGPRR